MARRLPEREKKPTPMGLEGRGPGEAGRPGGGEGLRAVQGPGGRRRPGQVGAGAPWPWQSSGERGEGKNAPAASASIRRGSGVP